jgi:hypothetical protein
MRFDAPAGMKIESRGPWLATPAPAPPATASPEPNSDLPCVATITELTSPNNLRARIAGFVSDDG